MSLRLGDIAPNFKAESTFGTMDFHEYLGNHWGILFSHPADYTPVCTTELGATAYLQEEFEKRHVKVVALSLDSLEQHMAWVREINETQHVEVNFPIIADTDRAVASKYDMIHPMQADDQTVRSLFIINPEKQIKLIITYPASTGRNFNEVIRVIDSLQLASQYQVGTPANWNKGEDVVILPGMSTDDAMIEFPDSVRVVKPYLRYIPNPDSKNQNNS